MFRVQILDTVQIAMLQTHTKCSETYRESLGKSGLVFQWQNCTWDTGCSLEDFDGCI